MNIHKFIWIVMIVSVAVALGWFYRSPHEHHHSQKAVKNVYYCPMHPTYTSDRPGDCPICNMALVKRKKQEGASIASSTKNAGHDHKRVDDYAPVQLDTRQRQLLHVRTVAVKKENLTKRIRAFGFVAHEIDLYKIQNEFTEAYQKYVSIYRDYRRVSNRSRNWETHRDLQTKVLEAEHNLLMLGLGPAQIENLRSIKWYEAWNQPELEMFKENNNYWVFAQIFERDLGFVEVGQKVEIEIPAFYEKLNGVIRSVGGTIDPETRTLRALIEIIGYRGELTANMTAYVDILSELGEHLVVPREAVMDLGTRRIVFVDRGQGVFDPVEVEVGFEGEGYWAVERGLEERQKVVASGNFLLDSESRLRAEMDHVGLEEEAGHVHH